MAKAPKGKGNVEVGNRFKRMLPVPINPKRVQEKRDRCFDIDEEIVVEQEKMEPYKTRVRELQAEKNRLHDDVASSTEDREVACVEERDYSKREVRIIRIDTRAVVESRTMTDADRSPEIPNLDKGAKRPAANKDLTPGAAIAAARADGKKGGLSLVGEGKGEKKSEPAVDGDDKGDEEGTASN